MSSPTKPPMTDAAPAPMGILEAQREVKLWRMCLAAVIAVLPAFSVGMVMSFAAPALVVYKDPIRSPLAQPLSDEEGSWFGKVQISHVIT